MTDSNPAIPQSQSPQNRDILAKVNAHADRSMDRLFADIDELLSDDLSTDNSAAVTARSAQLNTYSAAPGSTDDRYFQPPQAQLYPAAESIDAPPTATPKPKRSMPMWLKAFLGIGITSIAAGGIATWLVREQKIALPQNIDTSWIPFQSPRVAPADAKFADYLHQSIAKIETADRSPVAATPTTPATNPVAITPTTQAVPFSANPIVPATQIPAKTAIVAASSTPRILTTPIALVKTLPDGKRPGAVFQIDRQNKTVNLGQKIGTSNWSLLAVSKGEVTIKRKGGEIRSIDVGQKF